MLDECMMENLTDANFALYAAKAFSKPNLVTAEFEEDIARILYIKRLLTKYHGSGQLKERLLLNHLIVFLNVFGIEAATRMLWLKLDKRDWTVIKPFLVYLDSLPATIESVRGQTIDTAMLALDPKAIAALRAL